MSTKKVLFLILIFSIFTSGSLMSQGSDLRGFYQLNASYYDSTHMGDFVITKPYTEPISFYLSDWGGMWPYENLKLTPELADGADYTVLWLGKLLVPEDGSYTFRLAQVDDGGQLYVDGILVTDLGWNYPSGDYLGTPQSISLSSGAHDIEIRYENRIYYIASFEVRWSGPSFAEEVIPFVAERHWYFAATHVHSDISDGWRDIASIMSELDRKFSTTGGVCNFSEHITEEGGKYNTLPWNEEDFQLTGNVYPVRGEEWGAVENYDTGHASVFNVDLTSDEAILVELDNGNVSKAVYETMLADATGRGALVWANHPTNTKFPWFPRVNGYNEDRNGDGDYNDAGDWLDGLEGRMLGLEVWTDTWDGKVGGVVDPNRNQQAVDWWQSLLVRGERKVVGFAASDYHANALGKLTEPVSMVLAESASPDDIAAGMRAGHVIMRGNERSAYAILKSDADNNGLYESWVGDNIAISESGDVQFIAQCFGCKSNYTLRIYTSAGLYRSVTCAAGAPWNYVFSMSYGPGDRDFVRLEIRDNKGKMVAMTNPIYVNFP